jgi:Zn finger protein HypA/HybF involved in hydrogenase expression
MDSRCTGKRCCRGGLLSEQIVESRRAEIVCHECEERFLAAVPHEAVVSGGEVKRWVPAKESTRDVTCPECGSAFVHALLQ